MLRSSRPCLRPSKSTPSVTATRWPARPLAAMAIMLANLPRPGSGIVTPEGRRLEVGCDALTEGPLVTGGVLDEVVRPMRRRQDILLSQLERLLKDDEEEERQAPNRRWTLNHSPKPSEGETAFFTLMTSGPDYIPLSGSRGDQWLDAVEEPPSGRPDELFQRPRVIITASTAKILAQQLPAAHLGQPLVVIGLNQAAEVRGSGSVFLADRRTAADRTVRGDLERQVACHRQRRSAP